MEVKPYNHLLASLQNRAFNDCKSLVIRIGNGDPAAEHLLVKRYQSRVDHLARVLGTDSALRDDLARVVMLKIILNLRDKRLRHASGLRAYVDKTARFMFDGWRHNKDSQLEHITLRDDLRPESENDEVQAYLQGHDRERIGQEIETMGLSRDQALVFQFYMDHQEECEVCKESDFTDVQFDKLIDLAGRQVKEIICLLEGAQ